MHRGVAAKAFIFASVVREHGLAACDHLLGDPATELEACTAEVLAIHVARELDRGLGVAFDGAQQHEASLRAGELDRGVERGLEDRGGVVRAGETAVDLEQPAHLPRRVQGCRRRRVAS